MNKQIIALVLFLLAFLLGSLFDCFILSRKASENRGASEMVAAQEKAADDRFEWTEGEMSYNVMTQFWEAVWIEKTPRSSERKGYCSRYYLRKGQSPSRPCVLEMTDESTWQ